jgi:BirA family biotin operon repressor/biotin-[acetyl-CoA-carboxylase] ligase
VAKTLKEKYNIDSEFKRPNDLMVGTRKICGTLIEALSTTSKVEAAVIGIGLNVNAGAEEIPKEGISMKMLSGKTYSLEDMLEYILEELSTKVEEFYKTGTIK